MRNIIWDFFNFFWYPFKITNFLLLLLWNVYWQFDITYYHI